MNLNKLRGLRVEKGYTQEYMAKLIGISLTSYQRKESGATQFTANELVKIAEVLEIDIKEIFFTHNVPNWDKEGKCKKN